MSAPLRYDAKIRRSRDVARLIGVDEAGRGPWAGPVVTAAVLLGPEVPEALAPARDSKLLTPAKREALYEAIGAQAKVAVAWAHPCEIEQTNILRACLAAMGRAVRRLGSPEATLVLVDGNRPIPRLGQPQLTIVGGDRLSLAIACASIVAKVVRDRWMACLDRRYPGYGLAIHKGYGTEAHSEALWTLGPCPAHRRSYIPVAEYQAALDNA